MSTLKTIWQCMFTPRLYKIYGLQAGRLYEPSGIERWGDQVIQSFYMMWKFGLYTSPILLGILYRKGYFVAEGLVTLTKFVTSLGVILVVSYCMRGIGRAHNPAYQKFLKTLKTATVGANAAAKQELEMYDYDFSSWPVTFQWSDIEGNSSKHRKYISSSMSNRSTLQTLSTLPCQVIAYLAIHTFGIRLIYPGSIGLLQAVLSSSLQQGRSKLVEVNKSRRYKLKARDSNFIDVMFVNNRNTTHNGNVLVICCEGNAGFYEIGIMVTPIEAGYSVLGWNHPGFGGSTGTPYPDQEHNAIDIIMQFAIHKLGFKVENIMIFGWSIGGYSASWAAMNYPEVKGVILDATFDDIIPLAVEHMPRWAESIVRIGIRQYVNLNIFEQLVQYPGPVLLIRRSLDEVICTSEADLSTNRGNYLAIKMLKARYPLIFDDSQVQLVKDYLSVDPLNQESVYRMNQVSSTFCQSLMESYVSENSNSFPMRIGEGLTEEQKNQLALFLIGKYLKDYKSTHCTPLPVELLQVPWDIHIDSDYVFT